MNFMPRRLVIATRKSRLALWQAEHIQSVLQARFPATEVALLPMTTQGDEMLGVRLSEAGGKGLFVKELELALDDGRADLAVHSLKDMPVELPPGFLLAAITEREDPRDALVSNHFERLEDLPAGAVVGTASLRRASQIMERFPHLEIRTLRGNLDTRLSKLDRGEYAAIVLAAAGLRRLGMESRIRSLFSAEDSLPAAGQGALGIECRADRPDVIGALATLQDRTTSICVRAERAVNRALGGNCTIPLGAYAEMVGESLRLRALVAAPDGKRTVRAESKGSVENPEALGDLVAGQLRAQGADEILAALGVSPRA